MKVINYILVISLALLGFGCNRSFDKAGFYAYLNNTDNGYLIEKIIGDKKISMKYLPPQYFIVKSNALGKNQAERDSIKRLYADSRTFLLTIANIDSIAGPVNKDEVRNYGEYKELTYQLNFDIKDYFRLKTNNIEYKPVLTSTENTYGLQKSLNIILVFSPKKKVDEDLFNSEEYDLVFEDEIFNTGISHFIYYKKNIDQEINLKIKG